MLHGVQDLKSFFEFKHKKILTDLAN